MVRTTKKQQPKFVAYYQGRKQNFGNYKGNYSITKFTEPNFDESKFKWVNIFEQKFDIKSKDASKYCACFSNKTYAPLLNKSELCKHIYHTKILNKEYIVVFEFLVFKGLDIYVIKLPTKRYSNFVKKFIRGGYDKKKCLLNSKAFSIT